MGNWFFPSRGFGAIEGFSNPALEMFKGEPIRAMAREVCQNSLDAKKKNNKPLRIEFERVLMKVSDFPGMHQPEGQTVPVRINGTEDILHARIR